MTSTRIWLWRWLELPQCVSLLSTKLSNVFRHHTGWRETKPPAPAGTILLKQTLSNMKSRKAAQTGKKSYKKEDLLPPFPPHTPLKSKAPRVGKEWVGTVRAR